MAQVGLNIPAPTLESFGQELSADYFNEPVPDLYPYLEGSFGYSVFNWDPNDFQRQQRRQYDDQREYVGSVTLRVESGYSYRSWLYLGVGVHLLSDPDEDDSELRYIRSASLGLNAKVQIPLGRIWPYFDYGHHCWLGTLKLEDGDSDSETVSLTGCSPLIRAGLAFPLQSNSRSFQIEYSRTNFHSIEGHGLSIGLRGAF